MRLLRDWQKYLEGIAIEEAEFLPEPDTHDQVGSQEIVEPPDSEEDQEQAHGGDDSCQEIEDAPEREEAQGNDSEHSGGQKEDAQNTEDESGCSEEEKSESNDDGETPEAEDGEIAEAEDGDSLEHDDDSGSDDDDDDDSESEWGQRNQREAFSLDLERARRRRLATTFSTVIGKIAEDLSGWPIPGDDEWDIPALMERRLSHRPLSHCRQSREKESVILILDTSGSCSYQAEFYAAISHIAAQQGDVEMFIAPNASIEGKYTPGKGWTRIAEYNAGVDWQFMGRTIIFFGDFDGGDSVVEASRKNKVFWFSCEGNRYQDMDEHSWCSFTLSDFRGKYYDCETEDDFLRLAKKIR